jgi:hypothetical protein
MEGIENVLERSIPRTLRFGSRLIAGINSNRRQGRRRYRHTFGPAASRQIIAGADRSPGAARVPD